MGLPFMGQLLLGLTLITNCYFLLTINKEKITSLKYDTVHKYCILPQKGLLKNQVMHLS